VQLLRYFSPETSRVNDHLRKTGLDEEINNVSLEKAIQICGLYSTGCWWYHKKGLFNMVMKCVVVTEKLGISLPAK
jgi:hypothetical protein